MSLHPFERLIAVEAAPDRVFAYVSDAKNMPEFLSTVEHADRPDTQQIHMTGKAMGQAFDRTGYFRIDESKHRMEWGSESASGYRGWLQVKVGDASPELSEITLHLDLPLGEGVDVKGWEELILSDMQTTLSTIARRVLGL